MLPVKRIHDNEDMETWKKSHAYGTITGFIAFMGEGVQGIRIRDVGPDSPIVAKLVEVLNTLSRWVDEIPPVDQPTRFGNKAFRTWCERLNRESRGLIDGVLPDEKKNYGEELAAYFTESFGNSTRIDYGTGHELSFVCFLCCLNLIEVLTVEDRKSTVLRVFATYLTVMRKIQRTYMLEPAGSHGVWGLDDFQFVPYIWGSSQLMEHKNIQPKSFFNEDIFSTFAKDFMFLGCIKFIMECKSGPFHEHSPILHDISGVPTWSKVNSGLQKMFKVEVLHKFPVVQHLLFGQLLRFEIVTA